MPLTWKSAKQILSPYVGRGGICQDDPRVDLFVHKVLDYLLISGHYGNIHKFCFCAVKGCFTVPYELEVPLKIKIDDRVGTVWDKWYEFYTTNVLEDCLPQGKGFVEDPNYYPIVYDLPDGGARVGVVSVCTERADAFVIVKGFDLTGREIITVHDGKQVVGEYLSIKHGEIKYTQATFAQITAVVKSKTMGYTQLLWLKPTYDQKGFLADYSPLEEHPAYRRFKLTDGNCGAKVKVSVLGKIRLKETYTDLDYIPFDNLYTLEVAGQAVNLNTNNSMDQAIAKDKVLVDLIGRDNAHHSINNGRPVEIFQMLSGGSIKNII